LETNFGCGLTSHWNQSSFPGSFTDWKMLLWIILTRLGPGRLDEVSPPNPEHTVEIEAAIAGALDP
jgi:hypothetical protein